MRKLRFVLTNESRKASLRCNNLIRLLLSTERSVGDALRTPDDIKYDGMAVKYERPCISPIFYRIRTNDQLIAAWNVHKRARLDKLL